MGEDSVPTGFGGQGQQQPAPAQPSQQQPPVVPPPPAPKYRPQAPQPAPQPAPEPKPQQQRVSGERKLNKKALYGAVAVIIIAAAVYFVLFKGGGVSNLTGYDNVLVGSSTMAQLEAIAQNTTLANRIGAGLAVPYPTHINSTNVTMVDGKPAVIYLGADYCPYCAIIRWGMIIALMRYGNFSNLHYMTSDTNDIYKHEPTFTFYNSSYASSFISLQAVETATNQGYNYPLQTPTQLEGDAFTKYDTKGSIPFLDFGNTSVLVGSAVLPTAIGSSLYGPPTLDWNQIIARLSQPNTTEAQGVIGEADVFTAEICAMTNSTPPSVCSQPYVKNILGG